MKLTNFKISDDHIAIEDNNGRYYDLHNNFDLEAFQYDFKERCFRISWTKSMGDWVKADEAKSIKLSFSNVIFLRIKELDQEGIDEYREEDTTLNMIGYSPKEGSDMESYLAIEEDREEKYAIIIQTQNGQTILIFSEFATVEIG